MTRETQRVNEVSDRMNRGYHALVELDSIWGISDDTFEDLYERAIEVLTEEADGIVPLHYGQAYYFSMVSVCDEGTADFENEAMRLIDGLAQALTESRG
jgi:hypothetical protein